MKLPLDLQKTLAKFITYDKVGRPIGRDGRIRINYFLDILSAMHNESVSRKISTEFCAFIRSSRSENYDAILGPKRGNSILQYNVGKKLKKRTGFIKDSVLFGRWVEGNVPRGAKSIMIDDIASDGEMLRECVLRARMDGIHVSEVFVMIDRTEGDSRYQFEDEGIKYTYQYDVSDGDLQEILGN